MNTSPVSLLDYKVTTSRNKHSRNATTIYVTAAQRKTLIQHLGDRCALLFNYYMEKPHVDGFDYKDSRAAKALGYTERMVQRARLQLTSSGWFLQSTYRNHKGRKVIMTFLGQKAVYEYKRNGHTLRISESSQE